MKAASQQALALSAVSKPSELPTQSSSTSLPAAVPAGRLLMMMMNILSGYYLLMPCHSHTVHIDHRMLWNLKFKFARPGKSWNRPSPA